MYPVVKVNDPMSPVIDVPKYANLLGTIKPNKFTIWSFPLTPAAGRANSKFKSFKSSSLATTNSPSFSTFIFPKTGVFPIRLPFGSSALFFIATPLLFLVIIKNFSLLSFNKSSLCSIKSFCLSLRPLFKTPSAFRSAPSIPLKFPCEFNSLELFISVYTKPPSIRIGSLLASTKSNLIFSDASVLFGLSDKSSA